MSTAEEQEGRAGLRAWLRQRLADRRPIRVVAYRGLGTPAAVTVQARALRDPQLPQADADDSSWENLLANIERLESDEVAGVAVRAELLGQVCEAVSDSEGYLTLQFSLERPADPGWHLVRLSVGGAEQPPGAALVPPPGGTAIVSDIDDTVLESAVTSPLRLARLLLLENASTRALFEGVPQLYRALAHGVAGDRARPIFYLSGSPWNLYDLLSEVFARHGMPDGPLLLRSLERETVLPALRGASSLRAHKLAQIERLMALYPDKRFILLGDSGQKDPEIYAEAARRQPGRIAAIYIRDVSGARRDAQVAQLAAELQRQGTALTFGEHTAQFAEDAAARGLIER